MIYKYNSKDYRVKEHFRCVVDRRKTRHQHTRSNQKCIHARLVKIEIRTGGGCSCWCIWTNDIARLHSSSQTICWTTSRSRCHCILLDYLSFILSSQQIDEQIENLFNKIDYNAEELISWDELCTYLQLNFDEKSDAEQRAKEVSFVIPAKIHKTPHRHPCSTIALSSDHQYLALGSVSICNYHSPSLSCAVRIGWNDLSLDNEWWTENNKVDRRE